MAVVTVTVNQWHIKSNAAEGTNLPVICVNRYEYVKVFFDQNDNIETVRE